MAGWAGFEGRVDCRVAVSVAVCREPTSSGPKKKAPRGTGGLRGLRALRERRALEVALQSHEPLARGAGLAFGDVARGRAEHLVDVVELIRQVGGPDGRLPVLRSRLPRNARIQQGTAADQSQRLILNVSKELRLVLHVETRSEAPGRGQLEDVLRTHADLLFRGVRLLCIESYTGDRNVDAQIQLAQLELLIAGGGIDLQTADGPGFDFNLAAVDYSFTSISI